MVVKLHWHNFGDYEPESQLLLKMENDARFLRADPRKVEATLRKVAPVKGRVTTTTAPPQPSIDGPRGGEASLRSAAVGDAVAGSSADADTFLAHTANRHQQVEGDLRSG